MALVVYKEFEAFGVLGIGPAVMHVGRLPRHSREYRILHAMHRSADPFSATVLKQL